MNYIDLVSLLSTRKQKGLDKCIAYGKVVRELDRPSNIFNNVHLDPNGHFIEVDLFAVNLGYHSSQLRDAGIVNKSDIYMVNGSMITFVNCELSNDWYEFKGTLRFGTKDLSNTYVGMLTYYKDGSNWTILPSSVSDIEMDRFSDDAELYQYLMESSAQGYVILPDVVKALPRFVASTSQVLELPKTPDPVQRQTVIKTFNKDSRNILLSPNNNYKTFKDCLEKANVSRKKFIAGLISSYNSPDESYLDYMLFNLVNSLTTRPVASAHTGRSLVKEYLSHFSGSSEKYVGGQTVADYLANMFDNIAPFIRDKKNTVLADDCAWEVCKVAFASKEVFYGGMVALITGVSFDEMIHAIKVCSENGLNIIAVLTQNPYLLRFVSNFSFADIDKIAICFGQNTNASLDVIKNIVILDEFINDSSNSSTVFTKTEITRAQLGISIPKAKFETMSRTGSYLSIGCQADVRFYLRDCDPADLGYTKAGFRQVSQYRYTRVMSTRELIDTFNNYVKTGLGVVVGDYVTSSNLLKKELFVFDKMSKIASNISHYSHADIDKYIGEFEDSVGFNLEDKQRDAVHLIVNGGFIVTGGAGSGKTTVSNCIVYVLSHLEPDLELRFAAPTGKAAKRMQEVVHRPVKTLHSLFKIGTSDDTLFEKDFCDANSGVAYFIDESAMISLDLMYNVLKRVDDSCRVFMFGDVCQLPPIGKGLVFKNLLRFMPCVFLDVSKRAAAGSNITRNSDFVNEYSEYYNYKDLESGSDFWLVNCKSENIQDYAKSLCAYYLGVPDGKEDIIANILGIYSLPYLDVSPDEIQVVTPFAKQRYSWGSSAMNSVLKPLFNPGSNYRNSFIYQVSDNSSQVRFSVADRVIHTDRNMYQMQWYVKAGSGVFQKVYGAGICNGEVGKILGFYRSDSVTILDEIDDPPFDFYYPESLRDDKVWNDDGKYFVAVEYHDYLDDRDIVILYRAELNLYIDSNEGIVFKGEDISKLSLFYAGTTHKLQGSEYDLVICLLDNIAFNGFLTREMLYTMMTRGKKLVFCVGSVSSSSSSMLSRARRDIASANTMTVGEMLF